LFLRTLESAILYALEVSDAHLLNAIVKVSIMYGICLIQLKHFDYASQILRLLFDVNSKVSMLLAFIKFSTGELEAACSLLDSFEPEVEELIYFKAFVYFEAGKFEMVVKTIQTFVSSNNLPGEMIQAKMFSLYGNALSVLGKKAEAEFSFASALTLSQEETKQLQNTYNRALHDIHNGILESPQRLLETIYRALKMDRAEPNPKSNDSTTGSSRFFDTLNCELSSEGFQHSLAKVDKVNLELLLGDVYCRTENWNAFLNLHSSVDDKVLFLDTVSPLKTDIMY
jgi:tetratricopeptide (TPR) repeat protein